MINAIFAVLVTDKLIIVGCGANEPHQRETKLVRIERKTRSVEIKAPRPDVYTHVALNSRILCFYVSADLYISATVIPSMPDTRRKYLPAYSLDICHALQTASAVSYDIPTMLRSDCRFIVRSALPSTRGTGESAITALITSISD